MTTPREILHRNNIRPSRKLSQSFLVDVNTIHKIASASRILPEDMVVEIGAGIGVLTKDIAHIAKRVIAVELDPRLVEILQDQFAGCANVEIYSGDILKFDFAYKSDQYKSKFKVIGNVPYNISSPVIFHLLSYRAVITNFTLMLKKKLLSVWFQTPGIKVMGFLRFCFRCMPTSSVSSMCRQPVSIPCRKWHLPSLPVNSGKNL